MKRKFNIHQLTKPLYDLAIIGGGITGAGIFREAVKRGYRCLLLEKNDFASGTSSRSAKLVHGGLRYLQYFKIRMVREGLRERNYLLRHFSHVVKPLPFIFPLYSFPLKYRVGFFLYNLLGNSPKLPPYRYANRKKTLEAFPHLEQEGLTGSVIYHDAVTHDARLCNEIIHRAAEKEGSAALNYCEVSWAMQVEDAMEVQCYDHLEQDTQVFRAKYIVNAAGPWIDQVSARMPEKQSPISGPSKGIHITLSRNKLPLQHAIIFSSFAEDGRMNYALPWEHNTVIVGTTDTEFSGNPGEVTVAPEDVQYLLHSLEKFTPDLKIGAADVLSSWAGIRPLIRDEHDSKDRARDYKIWWSGDRVLNIFGGKLTSFHSMGKNLLRALGKKMPAPRPRGRHKVKKIPKIRSRLDKATTAYIRSRFGPLSPRIYGFIKQDPSLGERLHPELETLVAELHFFARYQSCHYLGDLLNRRLSLGYILPTFKDRDAVVEKAAAVMQIECGWSDDEKITQISTYLQQIKTGIVD